MSEENKNIENTDAQQPEEVIETLSEVDNSAEEMPTAAVAEPEITAPIKAEKKRIRLSLKSFILSSVAVALACIMLMYAVTSSIYQKKLAEIYRDAYNAGNQNSDNSNNIKPEGSISEVDIIDLLLGSYFYGEVDKDKLTEESLKSYLAATGDIYAAYYTEDEVNTSDDEAAGRMYGIGVNIINYQLELEGRKYAVLKIINVMQNSPALEKGLKAGDMIAYTGIGANKVSVDQLGYDDALAKLKGEENTNAEFTILRKKGDGYETIEFTVPRREVITESVYSKVSELDSKVGIIKITSFELKTPTQFEDAIEKLKGQGCEKFVIDVRYNPGGYEISIAAVLAYFLNEGDVYIRTNDNQGKMSEKTIGAVSTFDGDYASCNIAKEDIGKYRDLDMTVLCNENTASAAELFVATFKDYGLGEVVGTNTFGKGKMQTTFKLSLFGLKGAVKFTTHMYYSAKSDNYDGVGIAPDHTVKLSAEAAEYNIYDLPESKDSQLQKAIEELNKQQ